MAKKVHKKHDNHSNCVPRHVAIVMDGNGRWAKARFMPRLFGHKKGVDSVRKVIRHCSDAGVECLTLFAFSSENWKRPQDEVNGLMSLFMGVLEKETAGMLRHNVQLQFIGDRSAFSPQLQAKIALVEQETGHCGGLKLAIAANYGGRWDILQAVQSIAAQVQKGDLKSDELTEVHIGNALSTYGRPDPDLFIRTGGEQRISNFLLWQLAYAELFFSDKLWPEFDEQCLQQAFDAYAGRERRFGMISEQVNT